jgi:uncharacterized SAM-dependent methyltransferase
MEARMVHHVYNVAPRNGGFGVEHIGKLLEVYPTREEAEAAADRLAKMTQVGGHDAEVIIEGDHGEVQSDNIYRRVER